METSKQTRWERLLAYLGVPVILFAAVMTVRILWEETALTIHQGPQMLGFSLAHGSGAILFLAPPLLLLWLTTALLTIVIYLLRRKTLSGWFWSSLVIAGIVFGLIAVPPVFWQWLFIRSFAKSPHAGELMVYAAAEGDLRTVRAYIDHGVPVEATNNEGSTAAFTAAVEGNVPVIEFLAARKANLNATNLYGDSPLEAAIGMNRGEAATALKAHGAIRIRGTPEQRQAASEAIVAKAIAQEK